MQEIFANASGSDLAFAAFATFAQAKIAARTAPETARLDQDAAADRTGRRRVISWVSFVIVWSRVSIRVPSRTAIIGRSLDARTP